MTLFIEGAELFRDTAPNATMSPYCIISSVDKAQTTKTHINGGKIPKWNETFELLLNGNMTIGLSVWDDMSKVGSITWCLYSYLNKGSYHGPLPLFHEKKEIGKVLIKAQF
jgi:Ca2+-dependent lipid-binding protein